jgi:TRAP-type C4-dicarboxylate transport system permease small subunit
MLKLLNQRFEEILACLLLTVMAVIAFLNVVIRYLSTQSFAFTEEVVLNLFVWLTLLGISYGYRTNAHLAMEFAFDRLPLRVQSFCRHFSNALSVVFFLILGYWGVWQVSDEIVLNSVTEALRTPTWIYSICVPAFSLLIIVRILQQYAKAGPAAENAAGRE